MPFQKGHPPYRASNAKAAAIEAVNSDFGPPVTDEDLLLTSQEQQITTDDLFTALPEALRSEGVDPAHRSQSSVYHRRSKMRTMYDSQGYPSQIAFESVAMAMRSGFHARCPLCNTLHPSTDPNACPARKRVSYTLCPVCAQRGLTKKIYDIVEEAEKVIDSGAMSVLPEAGTMDAATRLRGKLLQHMRAYHPEETIAMGLMQPTRVA